MRKEAQTILSFNLQLFPSGTLLYEPNEEEEKQLMGKEAGSLVLESTSLVWTCYKKNFFDPCRKRKRKHQNPKVAAAAAAAAAA